MAPATFDTSRDLALGPLPCGSPSSSYGVCTDEDSYVVVLTTLRVMGSEYNEDMSVTSLILLGIPTIPFSFEADMCCQPC